MAKPFRVAVLPSLAVALAAPSAFAQGNEPVPSEEPGAPEEAPHRQGGYEDDPSRTSAIAVASVTWSLNTLVTSVGFLGSAVSEGSNNTAWGTSPAGWLAGYDLNMAITPSIPRWVMGDTKGALIYTGIRGASVAIASFIPLTDGSGAVLGATTLGFLVPVILGVVDLATTPHREDLAGEEPAHTHASATPVITGIAPAAIEDPNHRITGGIVRLSARF